MLIHYIFHYLVLFPIHVFLVFVLHNPKPRWIVMCQRDVHDGGTPADVNLLLCSKQTRHAERSCVPAT